VYTESYQKEFNAPAKCTRKLHQQDSRSLFGSHKQRTRVQLHRRSATSTRPRQRRAPPRDIVSWPHQLIIDYFIDLSRLVSTNKLVENGFHVIRPHELYINFAVRRDYSPPSCTGSTSTLSCVASTRLSAAAALHRLRRTPPRRRLLGIRLLRLLISTGLD
jgi:hypothetical protein